MSPGSSTASSLGASGGALACSCGACASRSTTEVALKRVPASLRSGSNKKTAATLTSGSEGSVDSRCSSTSFSPGLHTQVKKVFPAYLARYAVQPFPILRSTKRQGAFASRGPCHTPAVPLSSSTRSTRPTESDSVRRSSWTAARRIVPGPRSLGCALSPRGTQPCDPWSCHRPYRPPSRPPRRSDLGLLPLAG